MSPDYLPDTEGSGSPVTTDAHEVSSHPRRRVFEIWDLGTKEGSRVSVPFRGEGRL